ncbi:MAG TPA: dimethylsulfonioproprionate lyase family protein [Acetobacteraceae bacterium]|jgi:quercetin dioxygenase-like cupin family protein|nr:dimethylsulfonioproprionate lyase family protein [Acetobacteraceae bacterium]
MIPVRSPALQTFLTRAKAVIGQGSVVDGPVRVAADRMFTALNEPSPEGEPVEAARLPVCDHLPVALARARGAPGSIGALANAFAAMAPRLCWKTRPGAEAHGEAFSHGHANAIITGPDEGLEIRPDVRIGVSMMAPQKRYPDHHHPPEEIYIVLSDGEWWQADGAWHAPGIGGLVYNPPDILHAMRSADTPLLALWFLWTGPASA